MPLKRFRSSAKDNSVRERERVYGSRIFATYEAKAGSPKHASQYPTDRLALHPSIASPFGAVICGSRENRDEFGVSNLVSASISTHRKNRTGASPCWESAIDPNT